jgi:hypothetical protein
MNAHDSGYRREPARALTEGTLALLRSALEDRWRNPAGPEEPLREALIAVAAEARARSLRPEELIIAVKAVLSELSANQPDTTTPDHLRLREWVITVCIEAYYGSQ